jgi:chromosome segregation ATPase
MNKRHPVSASIMILLFASACQTTDPNKGGFFGGVGGLTSGNYQKGVDDRNKALEDEKDKKIGLTREADRADQRNQALESEIASTQAELDTLQSDVTSLRVRIEKAEAAKATDQTKLDALKSELESIEGEIEGQSLTFDETEKRAKVDALQRRYAQLEEAIRLLTQ